MTDTSLSEEFFLHIGQVLAQFFLVKTAPPFRYQLRTLVWMMMREEFPWFGVRGGINAQAMGLGKTMQMIMLVLADRMLYYEIPPPPLAALRQVAREECERRRGPVTNQQQHPASIVVASHEARRAWLSTIESVFRPGSIRYHIIESVADLVSLPPSLHLVFVSTGLARAENLPVNLPVFRRLIFDEAHDGRNPQTNLAQFVKAIRSEYRWAMSAYDSLITNSIVDTLTMLDGCLLLQEPRLQAWIGEQKASPSVSLSSQANTLAKHRLDLTYLDNVIFMLGMARPRLQIQSNNDELYTLQEQNPALLYATMLGIPVSTTMLLRQIANQPELPWELIELAESDQGQRLLRKYRAGRGSETAALTNLMHNAQLQLDPPASSSSNDYQTTRFPAVHVGRIWLRYALFTGVLPPEQTQSVTSLTDRSSFNSIIERSIERLHYSQLLYQRLIEGIAKQLCTPNSHALAAIPGPTHGNRQSHLIAPGHVILFVRPPVEQLERDLVRHLHSNLLMTRSSVSRDFNIEREAALHPDLLLIIRGPVETQKLVQDHPVLAAYYSSVWESAKREEPEHPEAWIARTAHKRIRSTKLRMLHEYLYTSVMKDEKVVIFTSYTWALAIIQAFVQDVLALESLSLMGAADDKTRKAVFHDMETQPTKRILIANEAYVQSRNMAWANHVILMHSWWNVKDETQARGRIERPNQTNATYHSVFLLQYSIDILMRVCAGGKDLLRCIATDVEDVVLIDKDPTRHVSAVRVMGEPRRHTMRHISELLAKTEVATTTTTTTTTTPPPPPPFQQSGLRIRLLEYYRAGWEAARDNTLHRTVRLNPFRVIPRTNELTLPSLTKRDANHRLDELVWATEESPAATTTTTAETTKASSTELEFVIKMVEHWANNEHRQVC